MIDDNEIRKAHQEWISALDMLEDLIFIHDKNFHLLRCNNAYQKKAGIPYSQIIGRPYYDVFPKTHEPIHNSLTDMEKNVDIESYETLNIGDETYYSRAYTVKDKDKNYLYSVHTLEDITTQVEIQNALKTSEAQYRRLFESAKDGILILDADTGLIIDANPFILNLTAYTLDEISGKNLWEIGLISNITDSKISFEELQNNDYMRYDNLPINTKDNKVVDVEFVSNIYQVGKRKIIQCNIRDITERMKILNALQTSEAQYRRLFESAKDGILIIDTETGLIIDANPFILNLASYTLEEITGKNLWEIGLISDIAQSKISFEKLQENDYIRYEDLPIKTKKGQIIDVEFVSNIYYVGGKRVIQCNIRDITEQIKSKKLLQESEEKFRTITTTAQDAIIIMNDKEKITYWNEAATYIFGYTENEVIGKELHPLLAPGKFLEAFKKGFSKFKKTGKGFAVGKTIELIALKKDGSEFPIELSLSANMKDDKWEAIGIVRDISKRKEDEAGLKMFRTLLDHSSDAIEVLDANTLQFVDVNKTAYKTLGYTRDELLSMNVRDIDSGLSESKLKAITQALKDKGSIIYKSTNRRKDGSSFPVEVSLSLVKTDKEYRVAIVRDITQSHLMQIELQEKEELMIVQSRHAAMGEMIGMIAHQWRQPITAIAMGANNIIVSAALETLDEENLNELAQEILDQTKYLSKTIDDFRNFFKPNKEREDVKISSIINDTLSLIGKSLENNNILVELDLNSSTIIQTYSSELLQVFVNIIKNSKEVLMERNIENPKILITAKEDEENIIITICDNAGGIEPKVIKRIFEPYFTTKDEKTGTGLGLYMSETIVNKHLYGKLSVKNVDQGVCFTVALPKKLPNKKDL